MQAENWSPYGLQDAGIDIAIAPLWLYKEPQTRQILEWYVAPSKVVVAPMSTDGLQETVDELSASLPDVIFLRDALSAVNL